jgi:hypothetical protein
MDRLIRFASRNAGDGDKGTDFDRTELPGRNVGRDVECFVQVLCFDNKESAQLLTGLSKRPVSYDALASLVPNAGRG